MLQKYPLNILLEENLLITEGAKKLRLKGYFVNFAFIHVFIASQRRSDVVFFFLLPPEKTFLLVLSKARQKMLDRCSPFSFTGLDRAWMACSMCHRSTRRSSPPEDSNTWINTNTLQKCIKPFRAVD